MILRGSLVVALALTLSGCFGPLRVIDKPGLRGTVIVVGGRPIAGASVCELSGSEEKVQPGDRCVATDAQGKFDIPTLSRIHWQFFMDYFPSQGRFLVAAPGYKTKLVKPIHGAPWVIVLDKSH